MKYLKQYEDYKDIKNPNVGDYVLMRSEANIPEISDYINNNIGKVTKTYQYSIEVTYDNPPIINLPPDAAKFPFTDREFSKNQIVDFSENKDELESKISSKKYNL